MNIHMRYLALFLLLGLLVKPACRISDLENFETKFITVQARGEIRNPGLYVLPAFSSTEILLSQLEIKSTADLELINGNIILKDGDVLVVPKKRDSVLKVSVNHGTLEQLMLVPGIGRKTAQNIIDYREKNGYFQTVDDLVRANGIGIKTLNRIREYLTL